MSGRREHAHSRLAVPDLRRDKSADLRRDKVPLEEEEDDPVEKAEWAESDEAQPTALDSAAGESTLYEREDLTSSMDGALWGLPDERGAHSFKAGDADVGEAHRSLAGQRNKRLDEPNMQDELYPPKNFAMVCKGVFRSAYPTKKNFDFLRKLKLKSVVYLCQEEYSPQVMQFYADSGVTVYGHGVSGNKEPFVDISDEMIYAALQKLLDFRTHPARPPPLPSLRSRPHRPPSKRAQSCGATVDVGASTEGVETPTEDVGTRPSGERVAATTGARAARRHPLMHRRTLSCPADALSPAGPDPLQPG